MAQTDLDIPVREPAQPKGVVRVKMPDGAVRFFPDSMSDDDIRKKIGTPDAPKKAATGQPPDRKEASPTTKGIGYVRTVMPDGAVRYFPDSLTDDQIRDRVSKSSGGQHETFWNRTANYLQGTPGFLQGLEREGKKETEYMQKRTTQEEDAGHPVRAAYYGFSAGVDQSIDKLAEGMFSRASLGLASLAMASSVFKGSLAVRAAAKTAQAGASGVFSIQGAKAALTPRQPGESLPDYIERAGMGAGQSLLAGAGTVDEVSGATKSALRKVLKLDTNLADKVAKNVAVLNHARAESGFKIDDIKESHAQAERQIGADKVQAFNQVQDTLEKNLAALQEQKGARLTTIEEDAAKQAAELEKDIPSYNKAKIQAGTQLVADTVRTLDFEQSRMSALFEDIGRSIPKPLGTDADFHAIIDEEASKLGIQPKEVPGAARAALGKPSEPIEGISDHIGAGAGFIGIPPGSGEPVDFNRATRIKDDLYEQSARAKDGTVRKVLHNAAERVSDMQEKAAKEAGQGAKYKGAKSQYMRFRRGIGSEEVSKWVAAENLKQQQIPSKLASLALQGDTAERSARYGMLRSLFTEFNIDPTDFDRALRARNQAEARLKTLPREGAAEARGAEAAATDFAGRERETAQEGLSRAAREAATRTRELRGKTAEELRGARGDARKAIAAGEAKGSIIPGMTTSELKAMSDLELKRLRMGSQTPGRMAVHGVQAFRLIQIIYGVMELPRSPMWGAMHIGMGGSAVFLPDMLRYRPFQDWVIQESGIPANDKVSVGKARAAMNKMVPFMRRAVKSQVPAAALQKETDIPQRPQ